MHIKIAKLESGEVNIHLHSPFRLSKVGRHFHFMALGVSIGREGFAFHILGFSFGVGWCE